MLRSNSHVNQLPGHYGCYGVPLLRCNICPQVPPKGSPVPLNVPLSPGLTLKGWVTYWIERQGTICPQVPPKGSPVPLNVPLSPGLTLKGWATYWIERQVTICPQVPPKGSPVPLNVPLSPGLTLKGWVPHWKFCGSGANVTPFGSGANVTLFQGRMWPPSLNNLWSIYG